MECMFHLLNFFLLHHHLPLPSPSLFIITKKHGFFLSLKLEEHRKQHQTSRDCRLRGPNLVWRFMYCHAKREQCHNSVQRSSAPPTPLVCDAPGTSVAASRSDEIVTMKHGCSSDTVCPGVGHALVSDTDPTPIITLNYVIFSNYYPCRRVGVRTVSSVHVCVRAS